MKSERDWREKLGVLFGLMVAVQFLTRLPAPRDLNPTEKEFAECSVWFPAVGLIVGGILAVVTSVLFSLPLAPGISALLVIALGVLLTGGFHEDGIADSADGFGGGWKKEDVLRIMRDSRIGSYGALVLVFVITMRVAFLWGMDTAYWAGALVVAHVLSRWVILIMMSRVPYARADAPGLGKPIVDSITQKGLMQSSAFAGAVCLFAAGFVGLVCMVLMVGVAYFAGGYFVKRIDGMTGDGLGATAVCGELVTLFTFALFYGAKISPWVVS